MSAQITLDLSTLRMLKKREKYERLHKLVPPDVLSSASMSMLKNFGLFFETTEADRITYDNFWPFLRTRYPKWKPEDVEFFQALIKPLDKDNPEGLDDQVITNLLTSELASKAISYTELWHQGEEVDLVEGMRKAIERYDASVKRRVRTESVVLGWDQMIEEETNDVGLQWRLKALQLSTRNLRPGDFGIVAMRPDRGKTTLIAQEVTYMAPQLLTLYPDEFRPAVWLNNEGPGTRILSRIRTVALGVDTDEFIAMGAERARDEYVRLLNDREDLIQVKDIHGWNNADVEELLRKINPGLVVFDMIDNIQFKGETMNNGERTDQLLEAQYQWARNQMVILGAVGIASSQISGDGEGKRYPQQTELKDSKTGKQGACDFIITGGYDPTTPSYRYIGMTKNKIKRKGAKSSPNQIVYFDQDRGRFNEPEEVE